MESADWARQEFGSARLGDTRRVDRLVTLAAAAVARPSGYVSAVANLGAELSRPAHLTHSRPGLNSR